MSVVTVGRETSSDVHNGIGTAGTTRTKLTNLSFRLARGVLLRTFGPGDNAPNIAPIWIGGEAVTADETDTGGVPIIPGGAVFLPLDDPSKLYVISTVADQQLAWIGM